MKITGLLQHMLYIISISLVSLITTETIKIISTPALKLYIQDIGLQIKIKFQETHGALPDSINKVQYLLKVLFPVASLSTPCHLNIDRP